MNIEWLFIAVLVAVVSPSIMASIINAQRRKERQQDHEIRKAEKEESNKRQVKLLERVSCTLSESHLFVNNKLDEILTFVNHKLTAGLTAELDSTLREVALMKEISRLHVSAGEQPTDELLNMLVATEERVREMRVALALRLEQADIAAAMIRNRYSSGVLGG